MHEVLVKRFATQTRGNSLSFYQENAKCRMLEAILMSLEKSTNYQKALHLSFYEEDEMCLSIKVEQ